MTENFVRAVLKICLKLKKLGKLDLKKLNKDDLAEGKYNSFFSEKTIKTKNQTESLPQNPNLERKDESKINY
jgi:hypothetical protein